MINASAAPAVLDAAPPVAAATAGTPSAPGFDSILMLQSLAGTAGMLDTGALEAGDTADLLGLDETDDEDEKGDELEASLAFLSALIAATTPRNPAGDLSADSGGQGAAGESEAAPVARAPGDFLEAAAQLVGADTAEDGSELTAGLLPVDSELETRSEAGQPSGRVTDMLSQLQRAGIAASEKPLITTHVRDPRWADEFGNRIALMVRAGESTASLQLTPVDLGPVEVNVTVREGQATIHFGAAQADTRALLEASLPRLREMLESQGFNLLDASVSSGFSRSQPQASPSRGGDGGSEAETVGSETSVGRALGLLDLYA